MVAAYGREKLFVARPHYLLHVNPADQRVLPQFMVPLESPAEFLRRDMLDVGKRFMVAIRPNGRKCLVIALH